MLNVRCTIKAKGGFFFFFFPLWDRGNGSHFLCVWVCTRKIVPPSIFYSAKKKKEKKVASKFKKMHIYASTSRYKHYQLRKMRLILSFFFFFFFFRRKKWVEDNLSWYNPKFYFYYTTIDAHFWQKAQWQKKPNNKENERTNEYKW